MPTSQAIFLVNLLQDVSVLRPLIFMAARDLGIPARILMTHSFENRDRAGMWRAEVKEIALATDASVESFANEAEAFQLLQGGGGIIFAGSESNLSAHAITHNILRLAPPSYVTVTLQHGFECIGFLQSRDHDLAHGRAVTFAADVVCGWCEADRLKSMAPSQRDKLHVTGPSALLQQPVKGEKQARGIVCENLHSVRLNIAGDFRTDFVTVFGEFCGALAQEEKDVVLRPHPGGQYVLKNGVTIPDNVTLNNNPIYKVDLSTYAYGISAPSSVLIDMVLADIPTAVWCDEAGIMDASNYDGLARISTVSEWLEFAREASAHPESFIERQHAFLERQKMPLDPAEVYQRFAKLLWAAARRAKPDITLPAAGKEPENQVLFVANGYIPTLQLSFVKPLAPLVEAGEMVTDFITEEQMKEAFGKELREDKVHDWLDSRLEDFRPTLMVFCRYSGPHAEYMTAWAREREIPVVFHVDDDLLNIPRELGEAKHAYHNHPLRIATVHHLLDSADLVYCSTERLKDRFQDLGAAAPLTSRRIYASGRIIADAEERPVRTIGYMGFDHAHDFEIVLPSLLKFLRRNSEVRFDLFGSIPKPEPLEEFGNRVSVIPPVRNYEEFLTAFSALKWDIGICPLATTPFNMVKANTKWVEYTSVGAAVIASRGTVYDGCCADGCGILADTPEEWLAALEKLTHDPAARFAQVKQAQDKLARDYSTLALRAQVLKVFSDAAEGRLEKARHKSGIMEAAL